MSQPEDASGATGERRQVDAERRALVGLAALGLASPATGAAAVLDVKGDESVSAARLFEVVKHYADAWKRGDVPAMLDCYHQDFTLHYPGDHRLAGTHAGKARSVEVLAEVSRRTRRSLVEIVSVMAGEERGAIIARERWRNSFEEGLVERVLVYSVQDGKLRNCWMFDADQKVVARFLG